MESLLTLASAGGPSVPWYHGIHLTLESQEFFLIAIVFVAVLITVYYIQRWIGDY